ncbi:MAG: hypothetical protein ACLP9K_01700, partial [Nitrososphaerales archaeon]
PSRQRDAQALSRKQELYAAGIMPPSRKPAAGSPRIHSWEDVTTETVGGASLHYGNTSYQDEPERRRSLRTYYTTINQRPQQCLERPSLEPGPECTMLDYG